MLKSLAIRILWILHALSIKRRPGSCPPKCSESHTYKWPCRARSKRIFILEKKTIPKDTRSRSHCSLHGPYRGKCMVCEKQGL